MSLYAQQIECLSCSNSRTFLHHKDSTSAPVGQMEALDLPRGSVLTCGRCGSTSLLRVWCDGIPYAATGYQGRKRVRRTAVHTSALATEPL